jgi:catechol 2,3-dioxygenase-like lactoylglutathione lyase family enzyme
MQGSLHHVEIYVRDLERSREFWAWLLERLGYTLYQEWSEGFSYILGETYIVFVQAESRFLDIPYHRCRAGLNHLAFHAESREFVDEITAELKARNIPILYPDRHPHAGGEDCYAVFFEDPDRMKVEITLD